ncbi:MAG: endonuclease domain-containing protein [Chitinophagaceae bacterium]|nr:endonuclease domain-containing protein [Chitinophagaceae bacterium]
MKKPIINNKPPLKPLRKQTRNHSTSAKATLWTYLQKSQLQNRKFRRQHSLGKFIADFYCPAEKSVIELDGGDQFWEPGMERDKGKEDYSDSLGVSVLHFENKWVFEGIDWVLEQIKAKFNHP